jgi:hypothetical protein
MLSVSSSAAWLLVASSSTALGDFPGKEQGRNGRVKSSWTN